MSSYISFEDFLRQAEADGIEEHRTRAWVREGPLEAYLRFAVHSIYGEMLPCLDVANVVVEEEHRNTGVFSSFLPRIESTADRLGRVVFVENVMVTHLAEWLSRRGYLVSYTVGSVSTGLQHPHFHRPPPSR